MAEPAWEQGGQAFADEAAGSHIYDVAKFIKGVRKVLNSDAFAAVAADDEAARVSLLFDPFDDVLGFKPYTSALSRYCSLNLESLQKHGTLEFRRFHGSCDPRAISHWAAFCVAFVESARHTSSSSLFARVFLCGQQHDGAAAADADEDGDFDEGLEALRVAQETASVEELVERLGSALDRSTIDFLLQDALG
jgi:Putative amidoligase enzyme.